MLDVGAKPWDRGRWGWYVRWTEGGQRRAKKVGEPGPDGERTARDVCERLDLAAARAATWDGIASEALPIDDAVRSWRDRYAPLRSERTQITDHGLVERLALHFGALDVRELTDDAIHGFASAVVGEGRSGHVAANALSILRRVVNLAERSERIDRAPRLEWAGTIRDARAATASETGGRDAWTASEVATILRLARRHEPTAYPVILAALHTGCRRGELLAMRWEDVDFSSRQIHVRRTAKPRGGTKIPKARRGRLVPFSETLAVELEAHRLRQRRGALKGQEPPSWVMAAPRGRPWQERNFARTWERLRRRFAGAGVRPLAFHCTRHTYITRALEAGRPVVVVAGWVGASPSVIERHYAHAIPTEWDVDFLDPVPDLEHSRNTESANYGDPGAIRTRDPQLRRTRTDR